MARLTANKVSEHADHWVDRAGASYFALVLAVAAFRAFLDRRCETAPGSGIAPELRAG
jgi:hypothetical protein